MLNWICFLMTRAYFYANCKSLVEKRRKELVHDVDVLNESTAYTADENYVTSSSAASGTPSPPTSQARNRERPPLSAERPGPYPVRRVSTPSSTGLHRAHPGAPSILCITFLAVHKTGSSLT